MKTLALIASETTVALSRRLNLRTKDEPAVTEIVTEAINEAAALGAPIVPPLTDAEIALVRDSFRGSVSKDATVTEDNGTLHL